jgi:hypothetical protein
LTVKPAVVFSSRPVFYYIKAPQRCLSGARLQPIRHVMTTFEFVPAITQIGTVKERGLYLVNLQFFTNNRYFLDNIMINIAIFVAISAIVVAGDQSREYRVLDETYKFQLVRDLQ